MLNLGRFSFGMGDRFAHEAIPQLTACLRARDELGVKVSPVWNKSHREHKTVDSQPASVQEAAATAVAELGWEEPWFVDADHINLETVTAYAESSNFFTIDVADSIGQETDRIAVRSFLQRHPELIGEVQIPGLAPPLQTTKQDIKAIASRFLLATMDAGRIYRHIVFLKGEGTFVTEVSMDETDQPQTPLELLVILAALADQDIPLQTIAPKFTGRFNKGVDYVGDVAQFEKEFREDIAVLSFAVEKWGLPADLKLSVHSGSDKFSIYPAIQRVLADTGAGLHLKTAGTTWLEELIGLAESGGDGLKLAQEVYASAHAQLDALSAPYAAVIDIEADQLPSPNEVNAWTAEQYVTALRHDPENAAYNPHLRQLLHIGYRIAAEMDERYLEMLESCRESVARNVTENLFERHLKPLLAKSL